MTGRPIVFLHSTVATHHSYFAVLLRLLGGSADVVLAVNGRLLRNLEPVIRDHPGYLRVVEIPPGCFLSPEASEALRNVQGAVFDEPFSLREMAGMLRFTLRRNRPSFLLTVHNANSWFFPQAVFSPSGLAAVFLRRLIMGQTRRCIVMGGNIRDHLREQRVAQDILAIPFGSPASGQMDADSGLAGLENGRKRKVRFVIPGMVSERRDYDTAMAAFGREELREKAVLVLLGMPSGEFGQRIMDAARDLERRGFEIVRFDSFVTEERFAEEMCAADAVLAPFPVRYVTIDGQVECYGRTKETGVAPLALTAAKPLVVPAEYTPPPEIATQVIPYKSGEDLAALMVRAVRDPDLSETYTRAARQNRAEFDLTRARRDLFAALGIGAAGE